MATAEPRDAFYVLGQSAEEYQRLSDQAELFGYFSEQLFLEAGLTRGMRVLDVGSGAGDVSMLARRMVGPDGLVMGVDTDAQACQKAQQRANAADYSNVTFHAGDIRDVPPNESFDAAVGRFVLMYLADPADALRSIASHVRVGGVLAFQEMDFTHFPDSEPEVPLWQQCGQWVRECFGRAGTEMRMGFKLYRTFVSAGLPAPHVRSSARIGGGPNFPAYRVLASAVRDILPALQSFGITTADEVGIETLEQRLRTEVTARCASVVTPNIVGAWTRKR